MNGLGLIPFADNADEDPNALPFAEDEGDPADYGYADFPRRNGFAVIPSAGPDETTCRTCGHLAIEHSAGRYSIYGVCPETRRAAVTADEDPNAPPFTDEPYDYEPDSGQFVCQQHGMESCRQSATCRANSPTMAEMQWRLTS